MEDLHVSSDFLRVQERREIRDFKVSFRRVYGSGEGVVDRNSSATNSVFLSS